jgi:predicted amidohydrolase
MLSPEGEPVGMQCATSLHLSLRAELETEDEIHLFSTGLGTVALCVDVDINAPAYARLARAKGAQLLIASQYIPVYDYNACRAWAASGTPRRPPACRWST